MRGLLALGALVLVTAPAALAGGWATVGVAPLPPEDIQAGETWTPLVTVLRHGRTPTDGATPSITIGSGGEQTTIPLRPTGTTGVYSARVVFPRAGTWSYAIDNGLEGTGYGMSATTTYKPIEVGGASARYGTAIPGGWTTGLVAALALALPAVGLVVRRRAAGIATAVPSSPKRA